MSSELENPPAGSQEEPMALDEHPPLTAEQQAPEAVEEQAPEEDSEKNANQTVESEKTTDSEDKMEEGGDEEEADKKKDEDTTGGEEMDQTAASTTLNTTTATEGEVSEGRPKRGRPARAAAQKASPPKKAPAPKTKATPSKGRARKSESAAQEVVVPTARGPGRKRKTSEGSNSGAVSVPNTPAKKGAKVSKNLLSWEDFVSKEVGQRVLSCGEGEHLGHPGRTTSKKPRKVDIVEDEDLAVIQVVAGGVHSLFLTEDNRIFSCGVNEKGTVPAEGVEREGKTDEFAEIIIAKSIPSFELLHGKVVMLTAGASFSAALTDKGSVIAWGNLRDSSGEVDVHPMLHSMTEKPTLIINHKKRAIVKIAAGENHLTMLSEDGHILTFGEGSMGQLGRTKRTTHIRSQYMVDESGESLVARVFEKRKEVFFKDIFAGGLWSLAIAQNGAVYSFGLNNFGHLGIPFNTDLKEEEAPAATNGEGGAQPGNEGDDKDYRVYKPTVAPAYAGKQYTHAAGVKHIVVRTTDGDVYSIGHNIDNALGLGNYDNDHWKFTTLQHVSTLPEGQAAGLTASLGTSIVWSEDGKAWSWGCDTTGQLGVGIKDDDDDKVVPKPRAISSLHLDGYKIISVSMADNQALFLAQKV